MQLDPKWPDGWWFLGSLQYGTNAYAPARDALTHYIDLAVPTPSKESFLALKSPWNDHRIM